MKRVHLTTWAAMRLDWQPAEKTLQRWARQGLIWPPARKQGRAWMVPANARKVDRDDPVLKSVWE